LFTSHFPFVVVIIAVSGDWNIVDEPSLVTEAQLRHAEELQQKLQQQQQSMASSSSSSSSATSAHANQFAHSIKLQVRKKKKKKKKKFLRNSKRNLCSFVSVQMQKINVLTLSIDKLLAEARDGDVKEVPLFMQKPCIQARFLKFPHWSIVFCGFG
jgi:hypothetical protein